MCECVHARVYVVCMYIIRLFYLLFITFNLKALPISKRRAASMCLHEYVVPVTGPGRIIPDDVKLVQLTT